MTTSTLRLAILQPGQQADEILTAIARTFGVRWDGPASDGHAWFTVPMAYPLARQRAERLIAEQGDDGQYVVRVVS